MTISNDNELEHLRVVGGIVARVLDAMGHALEPGMTTCDLDGIGRKLLDDAGARPAPELTYGFPGATCISVNEEVAHGVPGDRIIRAGDLVNIDVSAERDGFYADTGGSFAVPPVSGEAKTLCRDGRRAMWEGIRAVKAGARLNRIGQHIERFARSHGYTLIHNLASHGVGRSLHEEPKQIPTWYEPSDLRTIHEGMVFTIEPFLSTGAEWVTTAGDGWTLVADAPTVQYEHTIVASRRGAVIVTTPH